jgi:D-sedoheptulose 7-phosphate isomerase
MALGDNMATLTAIANDFSYNLAFGRQLEAFGHPGDVLVALSTSGNSESVVNAARVAQQRGISTIGMTGQGGGTLASVVDVLIAVPSDDVAHIQEVHQIIGHLLCSVSDMEIE